MVMKMPSKYLDPLYEKNKYKKTAVFLLFIFEFLTLSLALVYNSGNLKAHDLYTYIAILLTTMLSTGLVSKVTKGDNIFLLIVNMLFSIGVAVVYKLDPELGRKQLIFYIVGIFVFFIAYGILKMPIKWEDLTLFYFLISMVLFIITIVFAKFTYGAKNWVSIGGVSIQPSEFVKVPLAFFIASFYTNYGEYSKKPFGKYYMTIGIYIFIVMFFIQRELGTALIFFGVMIISQFVYERDRKLIAINILATIMGSILAYFLFSHIRIRVKTWLDPWSVIDDMGYQITQSLFALASGGLFGTGLGLGRPDYIPVAESDFIFPAICEEMGIFMGIAVVMLFLLLVYRALKTSLTQQNKFYSILSFCVGTLFALQTFIILGGVLKLIPLTGVTLPFISAGGSSMVSGFILLACLQYASEEIKEGEEINEKE